MQQKYLCFCNLHWRGGRIPQMPSSPKPYNFLWNKSKDQLIVIFTQLSAQRFNTPDSRNVCSCETKSAWKAVAEFHQLVAAPFGQCGCRNKFFLTTDPGENTPFCLHTINKWIRSDWKKRTEFFFMQQKRKNLFHSFFFLVFESLDLLDCCKFCINIPFHSQKK